MLSSLLSENMEEFDSSDKCVKNEPTWRSILFSNIVQPAGIFALSKEEFMTGQGEDGNSQFIFTIHFISNVKINIPQILHLTEMIYHVMHNPCHVKWYCSCTRAQSVMCNTATLMLHQWQFSWVKRCKKTPCFQMTQCLNCLPSQANQRLCVHALNHVLSTGLLGKDITVFPSVFHLCLMAWSKSVSLVFIKHDGDFEQ